MNPAPPIKASNNTRNWHSNHHTGPSNSTKTVTKTIEKCKKMKLSIAEQTSFPKISDELPTISDEISDDFRLDFRRFQTSFPKISDEISDDFRQASRRFQTSSGEVCDRECFERPFPTMGPPTQSKLEELALRAPLPPSKRGKTPKSVIFQTSFR